MRLFQKPPSLVESATLLKVNPSIFAELVSHDDSHYVFAFTFKLSLTSKKKDPRDYDRVTITVKRKESAVLSAATPASNFASAASFRALNPLPAASIAPAVNGLAKTKMSPPVAAKLYSGLQLLKDLQVEEEFLARHDVPVTSFVATAMSNVYSVVDMVANTYRPGRQLNRESTAGQNKALKNLVGIDPTNLIDRVNRELCDPSSPVFDSFTSKLTTESNLEDPTLKASMLRLSRAPLSFDMAKYFLDDVPASPQDSTTTWYEHHRTTRTLEDVSVTEQIPIDKGNKNLNLTVRFDLYKKGTNVVDESLTMDLHVPSHVEAYHCLTVPPRVDSVNMPSISSAARSIIRGMHTLSIADRDVPGLVGSFNVYAKSIDVFGAAGRYRKLGSVRNSSGVNHFTFSTDSALSVIRVVPVDMQNRESNVFTNTIVGPGHRTIGTLVIMPCHFGKNKVRIDVHNIPPFAISLALYRRDCTENVDSSFEVVSKMGVQKDHTAATFLDESTEVGRVYEYYVFALRLSDGNHEEEPVVSNFVMYKNLPSSMPDRAISVSMTDMASSITRKGNLNVTFQIKTTVSPEENERITQTLKEQIGELYDQYLNPSANSSSPLGDDRGVPQYSDLFFHEVVRTNLTTAERETFGLVSDGLFEDKLETQKAYNIKPVNPQHAYTYQVFTFKKNPIELFKKFVARGVDERGREWFYLPYKWLNPNAKVGRLYPDDSFGIPIIDSYASFTSEAYGLTTSYQIDGSTQYTSLSQVVASRVDRNTVKVSWKFEGVSSVNSVDLYDSFVVMKVVNGVRSFVGRTHKSFIYHELSEVDIGSVYYIIVPIMAEFDIDEPAYSVPMTITPEGLVELVKVVPPETLVRTSAQQMKAPSATAAAMIHDHALNRIR